jgi:L-malate glycosyltransferase
MKILYVADAKSIHTRRWAEWFQKAGHDVHVATFREAEIPGVKVHVLPTLGLGKIGYFAAIFFLKRLARIIRPDVVHAHYLTSYGFIAAAAHLRPLVATAWGSDLLLSPQDSTLAKWLVKTAVSGADVVTTVAEHMNAAVVAFGVASAEVVAIPFGVDCRLFTPPIAPPAAPPPLRVISTRNFAEIYSVETLIDAVAQLPDLPLHLDLVGQGPLRGVLEAAVRRLGLEGRVSFHGHVEHSRLVSLLGQAHVFVTTAVSDGNNVSLNEAMACGPFPIATDIPANAQWIETRRNGLLFPVRDSAALAACIREAAADSGLRALAAAENRAIVEARADWRIGVRKVEQIYAKLAHTPETSR